ncbi:isochorismate synthase [soil metagenome]
MPSRSSDAFVERAAPPWADELRNAIHARAVDEAIAAVRVEVPDLDPVRLFDALPELGAFYWRARASDRSAVALGRALTVPLDQAEQTVADLPTGARLFGSLPFDSTAEAPTLVLPRLLFERSASEVSLTCFVHRKDDGDDVVAEAVRAFRAGAEAAPTLPRPLHRHLLPEPLGWQDIVESALARIGADDIQKVVLARCVTYAFESAPTAGVILSRLRSNLPDAYHFAVREPNGSTFLGASPERLLRLDGRSLDTEAVAGTRPRSLSDARDRSLIEALSTSEKDAREHALVREHIENVLRPLAEHVTVAEHPRTMDAGPVRHLLTPISAWIRPEFSVTDVLRDLHPTPAVCGVPLKSALQIIENLEPFQRGRYAGPVGWIGAEGAEFAVGIRSGLLEGQKLTLYAGAGIVAGSDPSTEWDETEAKLSAFGTALGIEAK